MEQSLVDRRAHYESYTAYLNLFRTVSNAVESQQQLGNALPYRASDPHPTMIIGGLATYHTRSGLQYEHNVAITATLEQGDTGDQKDDFTGLTFHLFNSGDTTRKSMALFGRVVESDDPFLNTHDPDLLKRTDMMPRSDCDFYVQLFSHSEIFTRRGAAEALRFLHGISFPDLYGDALTRFRLAREGSQDSDQQQRPQYSH